MTESERGCCRASSRAGDYSVKHDFLPPRPGPEKENPWRSRQAWVFFRSGRVPRVLPVGGKMPAPEDFCVSNRGWFLLSLAI